MGPISELGFMLSGLFLNRVYRVWILKINLLTHNQLTYSCSHSTCVGTNHVPGLCLGLGGAEMKTLTMELVLG